MMGNVNSEGMALEQTLEHASHDDEEIEGERVTLAQSTLAVDPLARFAIHEHRSFACLKDFLHPGTPCIRQATEL
jgi:hypothetical protein